VTIRNEPLLLMNSLSVDFQRANVQFIFKKNT